MENRDYYKILQVDPSAEPEVIAAAYRRLALKYHPDAKKAFDSTPRMQKINEAYEVLGDPIKRAQYDRERSSDLHIYEEEQRRKREEAEAVRRRAEEEPRRRERAETERRSAEYGRQERGHAAPQQRRTQYARRQREQSKSGTENLIKAGTIPVIAAAVAGALWLVGLLGSLAGVVFLIISAFAGY